MIVACPYCAGVIVLDETRVLGIDVAGDGSGAFTVDVTFLARHRCAPSARAEYVAAAP